MCIMWLPVCLSFSLFLIDNWQLFYKILCYLLIYLYHTCEIVKMIKNIKKINSSPVKYVTYSMCQKQYNSTIVNLLWCRSQVLEKIYLCMFLMNKYIIIKSKKSVATQPHHCILRICFTCNVAIFTINVLIHYLSLPTSNMLHILNNSILFDRCSTMINYQ